MSDQTLDRTADVGYKDGGLRSSIADLFPSGLPIHPLEEHRVQ